MKKIICLMLCILIILVGCKKNEDPGAFSVEDIFVGKKGVELEFLKDTPPKSVYHEQSFPLVVDVRNVGAIDISNGIIAIAVEDDYITITQDLWNIPEEGQISVMTDKTASFRLEGKDQSYPEGDIASFSIRAESKTLDDQSASHNVDIIIIACYDYQTKLSADICIDYDIYNEKGLPKSCEVKDQTFSSGQGAPIGVISVKAEMLPQDDGGIRPSFIIKVKNLDKGFPYLVGESDYVCSSEGDQASSKFNLVKISAELSSVPLVCSPSTELKLKDKEDYVRCQTPDVWYQLDPTSSAYTSPLIVWLDYGYANTISKKVEIKRFT